MSLIDELLGSPVEHVIDDGSGGRYTLSLRPRRHGRPVTRDTMISFRRPGSRSSSGFGIKEWALRSAASGEWLDPICEGSISLTRETAKAALAWVDSLGG